MRTYVATVAFCAAAGLFALSAHAEVAPGDVKFKDQTVPASLTGKSGNAKSGKKLFIGRKLGNCLACHANKDASGQQFHGEVGPALDGVAGRYSEAQLRAIVTNPKMVFGKQTLMPAFYRKAGFVRVRKKFKGKTILSAQQVEDVIAYLRTLKK